MKQFFTPIFIVLVILFFWSPLITSAQFSKRAVAPASVANPPAVDKSLQFIQNKNQWPSGIRFAADLPNGRLFLQEHGFVYNFLDGANIPNHHSQATASRTSAAAPKNSTIKGHAYRVTFLNAAPNATQLSGKNPTAGVRNYYLGRDPKRWAAGVKGYEEVNYQNLYAGVDMRLYEKAGQLKYEFMLQPRVSSGQIQMQYEGASGLALQYNGDLQITTSVTTIIERKPVAYQTVNGRLREVPCRFKLTGNIVSFDFPSGYDVNLPLLIDPVLVFSTFSGSTADNWGFTATYDSQGHIYSGGIVSDVGLPETMGAYDSDWNGNADEADMRGIIGWDIAILKYNPEASGGASLLYATYLGGSRTDVPSSLVANSKDELVILGTTSSADFPVTAGTVGTTFKGGSEIEPLGPGSGVTYTQGSDLIISRLSTDGSQLLASTIMGGTENDGLLDLISVLPHNYGDQFRSDVITDTADNVYVVSTTLSPDFPIKNAFQNVHGGDNDAVVFKLNAGLTTLDWSSYLGRNGSDAGYSIQLDAANNIFIAGGTTSEVLPGVTGAFKTRIQGDIDGFVAKITNDGQRLERVSYIGTRDYDQCYFVQIDLDGNVYLLGQTKGSYPVSQNVYSVANGKQFIQKLDNGLTTSLLSTVFGSRNNSSLPNISPTAFLVDDCSRIYVCGWGGGSNVFYGNGTTSGLPVTANAFQKTTDDHDFYLMLLSRDAAVLEYATFIGGVQPNPKGGEHVDGGTSRFDKRGFVYQSVCGGCGGTSTFPTTPNAWSKFNQSSNCNNAAFKFDFNIQTARAGDSQTICANAEPFQLTGFTPAGGTWSGPGVTPGGIFTPSPDRVGVQTLNYSVANGSCVSTGVKTITVEAVPEASFTGLPPKICLPNGVITLAGLPVGGIFAGPGVTGNTFDPAVAGLGTHTITYTFATGTNGCFSESKQQVLVGQTPVVVAGPDERICSGSFPVQLTGFSPAGGTWSGTGVSPTGLFTPGDNIVGTHVLTYTVTANNCTASSTKTIIVDPTIKFTQGPDQVVCSDSAPFLITDVIPPGGTWSGKGVSPNGLFTPGPDVMGTNVLTYFVQIGACSGISTKTITVAPTPQIIAGAEPTECGTANSIQGYAPFTAKFTNTTTGATGYLWNFGDGTTSTEAIPSHIYTQDGNYTVTLTVYFGNGCQITREVVSVLTDKKQLIPNIFTPNNDGKNDTFVPRVTCLPTDIKVFNRWGTLIFSSNGYDQPWDGTFNQQDLPVATYYYSIILNKNEKPIAGSVTIIK
ncbi:MAG: hypothetical protein AVDCRST_MAG95-3664 [uncultured Adhaeribacter sp.]|uniref:PKD domain-containing protein n=1 Tax=uncultured Adhaeribacter sp. TaxID=448109 RepID=A0A6J4JSM8_9BACT|nr:MAG: hypothetical protein AVDCRST_MAG95-3664 [uncultured Adhaeribacter sp.]